MQALFDIGEGFGSFISTLLLVDEPETLNDRTVQGIVPLLLQLVSEVIQEHEEYSALLDVVEGHPADSTGVRRCGWGSGDGVQERLVHFADSTCRSSASSSGCGWCGGVLSNLRRAALVTSDSL